MKKITAFNYPIYIDEHLLQTDLLQTICATLNKRIVLITDDHLNSLYTEKLQSIAKTILTFPAGEKNKTRETKQYLEDQLLEKNCGRDTCIIAFGGGVVLDLAGFIAATYCRGIPVIYIPTTLLAMVDASIGGKTGVNTPFGKNLIGTFTQPHAVLMDTALLNTLPKNEIANGFAEIIKHAMIADADLFYELEIKNIPLTDIIYQSCLIKKNIVEQDEKDHHVRHLLNFGHTIGHAIETLENYAIKHGEAVAIGMLVESELSRQCGFFNEADLARLQKILRSYQLPLMTNAFDDINLFRKNLCLDKKSLNQIPHFVLLNRIGQPHATEKNIASPVSDAQLLNALEWAKEIFKGEGL
ncbi:MAG: 3-dehydroquinate synthase [Gammaproteobacteria bacterium]|nr:3-dehydroquinate synthase [Gammaproteobacteria bacterium]